MTDVTEKLEGDFQPHVAYVRPGSTEQPYDDSESITDREPLGYATPDAYDETPTAYEPGQEDMVPYPVYIVEYDKKIERVRPCTLNTYVLGTASVQAVGQWNRPRTLFFRNVSVADPEDPDVGVIFLSDNPNGTMGFQLNPGQDLHMTTTAAIYAWGLADDGTVKLAVAQEHDTEQ